MTEWIVIPNWEKFQHRADRSLPWLKLYIELEGRDDWRQLTLAARGLLVCIWIEYRRSKGLLRSSDIPGRVAQKFPRRTLDSLVAAGFVQLSATQPSEFHAALEEKRLEKTPKPPSSKPQKPQLDKARRWIDNTVHELADVPNLERVIEDEFEIEDEEVVADLVAYATERMKSL